MAQHIDHAKAWLYKAEHGDARGEQETAELCALLALGHALVALSETGVKVAR